MITIGVISDTHLIQPDKWFLEKAEHYLTDTDMILHAGDLTSLSVLDVFAGKTVHAVHGNMCTHKTRESLESSKIIEVGNFEDRLFDAFAPIDCIVYGHTHKPVCHRYGPTLMINPGSFTITASYGIIKVDDRSMEGKIHYMGGAL
jgi:putative phosphoesterase